MDSRSINTTKDVKHTLKGHLVHRNIDASLRSGMATDPKAEVVPLVDCVELELKLLCSREAGQRSCERVSRGDISDVGFGRNPFMPNGRAELKVVQVRENRHVAAQTAASNSS